MSNLPEWLEYWIAKTDSSYYIISLTFFELIRRHLKNVKNKSLKKKIQKEAEMRYFKRN